MEFETVIGLEIHAQLKTLSKIFCGCAVTFGDQPNTRGCPVCLGLPGALPVLNKRAVELAIRAGIATQCTINGKSVFARKNYFYPDLPKGYQISQYDQPLCENGTITIDCAGKGKQIRLTRIHLEEDAGKLIHDLVEDYSLFDVNRCGVPLIEIVSEPDLRSPQEAYSYMVALKQILEFIDVSDCIMEQGSLRCDANISLREKGALHYGTKTELKNMNSFRNVELALEYEIIRQKDLLLSGQEVRQETFLWDTKKNITVALRSKEDAHDYRYFPDPDLLPLLVTNDQIESIRKDLPELPKARLQRFIAEYHLSEEHSLILNESKAVGSYFEQTVNHGVSPQIAANWILGEILRLCKEKQCDVFDLNCTPQKLSKVIGLITTSVISNNAGKRVIDEIEKTEGEPEKCIENLGLKQLNNSVLLESVVHEILQMNPKEVFRYHNGETKLLGYLIGQAMKQTRGKGNPQEFSKIFLKILQKK